MMTMAEPSPVLRTAGYAEDSQAAHFLVRYGELKGGTRRQLEQWLDGLTDEQRLIVRDVLDSAVVDCRCDTDLLTAMPFKAADGQLKLVPQFFGDGAPLVNFRLPRLNTVDAIDDALGAAFVPPFRSRG